MKNQPDRRAPRRPRHAHHTPPTTVPAGPIAPPPRTTWISLVDAGLRITAAVLNFIATFGGHH